MHDSKILIITGKGGAGKTTIATNLALALHRLKYDPILVDGNLHNPHVHVHFGIDDEKMPVSLHDVLNGKESIHKAIYEHESGLKLVPNKHTLKGFDLERSHHIKELKLHNNIVVVDGPSLGYELNNIMKICDDFLLIVNPEKSSVHDAMKIKRLAVHKGLFPMGIIVNKYYNNKNDLKNEEIEKAIELPIIGKIRYDNDVLWALGKNSPLIHLNPHHHISKEIYKMASELPYEVV